MTAHSRADTVHRLPHVNRHLIQIAQGLNADLVGQSTQHFGAVILRLAHAAACLDFASKIA